jgi:hypothetical protein
MGELRVVDGDLWFASCSWCFTPATKTGQDAWWAPEQVRSLWKRQPRIEPRFLYRLVATPTEQPQKIPLFFKSKRKPQGQEELPVCKNGNFDFSWKGRCETTEHGIFRTHGSGSHEYYDCLIQYMRGDLSPASLLVSRNTHHPLVQVQYTYIPESWLSKMMWGQDTF